MRLDGPPLQGPQTSRPRICGAGFRVVEQKKEPGRNRATRLFSISFLAGPRGLRPTTDYVVVLVPEQIRAALFLGMATLALAARLSGVGVESGVRDCEGQYQYQGSGQLENLDFHFGSLSSVTSRSR
jgi:hypothetical protein